MNINLGGSKFGISNVGCNWRDWCLTFQHWFYDGPYWYLQIGPFWVQGWGWWWGE